MAEGPKTSRLRWLWPVSLIVCIFFASGQSSLPGPDIINFDKLVHFSVFGLLATAFARALPPGRRIWGLVLASTYGFCDEVRQSFTPGRSVDFMDWIADTSGALVAVSAYLGWSGYRNLLEWKIRLRRRPSVAKCESELPDLAT